MKIFLIGGKARQGKDTLGGFIKEYYEKKGLKVCYCQISKYIKQFMRDYFGWNGSDETKPRKFMNEFGTDLIRIKMQKPKFFINRTIEDIEILSNYFDVCLVTDVRFPEEIIDIKAKFPKALAFTVIRPGYVTELQVSEQNHIIETALNGFDDYDYTFTNISFEQLKEDMHKYFEKEGL